MEKPQVVHADVQNSRQMRNMSELMGNSHKICVKDNEN